MRTLEIGNVPCGCTRSEHSPKLVVVTGGPGAGKTAVLELARQAFCEHVMVLPEAASIVFGGGFPRRDDPPARRAAQRTIFHVQRQLEALVLEERRAAVALCDRGTLDGLAYWPDRATDYFGQLGTTKKEELGRYSAVIHLHTPSDDEGYVSSPLRTESAEQAARIDQRIVESWEGHPLRFEISAHDQFAVKALAALTRIREQLPGCCLEHSLRQVAEPSNTRRHRDS